MANSKEMCLREWAPLTEVMELIPAARRGFFPSNLNITCVDAIEDFLALGSDAGIVFWYNRRSGEMQKLKAEVSTRITCVKIVNSVEYMVAAGSANGQVSVFQIQKELPPDLDLVAPCTRSKPIERYTIRDLHRCVVSCCEWSKNGMKLYSGDRQGVVVLTEFDYQTHQSKSLEILSEAYEIVQLSVYQSYLLVATLYRCIVCRRDVQTNKWQITQVGKKDRKQLIDCGGVFLKPSTTSTTTDNVPQIICGRPGLRFWVADALGNVAKTIIFNEAVLKNPAWEIPLLNPKQRSHLSNGTDAAVASGSNDAFVASRNFREINLYDGRDALLVTHDDATLYILNLERLRVEASASGFRKILDFCVCGKEIFVLEGERSLLRLAPMPEPPNKTAKVIFNPMMPPPLPMMGASPYSKLELESPVEMEPTLNSAEECFELPAIEKLDLNVPVELAVESPLTQQNRRLEIFQRIGEMDFDQSILHTSGTTSHKKRKVSVGKQNAVVGGIVEIGQETHERRLPLTSAATLMEASYCQMENNGLVSPMDMKAAFIQHLPDALTPTTLQKTIAEKAKTLAAELDLPEVHLAPVNEEELRSKLTPQTTTSLINCYPSRLETTSVQTTPRKKAAIDDAEDYSTGQPVDGICASTSKASVAPLKFVKSQPKCDDPSKQEYTSFLPDFRCAGDPFKKEAAPPTADSNSSSEWEFLDN
ncbi:WD repeat-containing protein CG11141 [Drosophila sulfurigaster albostrigata]|uniref:WD repeat-containing protein CG11141 n=1 Tax=Drosophila sulfurigaster albostrigata TaxID=89887 RepID=UPI002D21E99D|nr:WD repeat-containing protein CG11141 [Drosophila sulfurigaster albostrigata]